MEKKGEIILYQPDEAVRLEVRLEDETVWLTQAQMAELFGVRENTITYHVKEIYSIGELESYSTTRKNRVVRREGTRNVKRSIDFYNLDMIISVGYRVSSKRGVQFRQWATRILKENLLKGYSINQRFEQLEQRVSRTEEKIDFFVRTSLPPVEGIFYKGQIFDAYKFATDLIRSAKKSLLLIDNYIDESVLLMLSKRRSGVCATVYTQKTTAQLQLDIEKHNRQYSPVEIRIYNKCHDRFLIIDNTEVYHIGASMKDLGKKMFAFSRMDIPADTITKMFESRDIGTEYDFCKLPGHDLSESE